MPWLAPTLLAVGFALSLALTPLAIAWGRRTGALDSPGAAGHEKALRHVPNTGGIAITLAWVAPVLAALGWLQWGGSLPQGLDATRSREGLPAMWAIVAAVIWLHGFGRIDDRRAMSAGPKLLVQAVPAVVLAWAFDLRPLTLLDQWGPGGHLASVALGVAWMLLLVNAMNYLDNMDGLSAGVGAIAALLFAGAMLVVHQWFVAGLFALLAGALMGFLVFNFPLRGGGARVFMGDGGSLPMGLLLAVLALRGVYTDPADPTYALGGRWYGVLAPPLVLAVPIYDLLATSWIRVREGRNPFVGDQRHLSHRLVARGFTPRGAVLCIWALGAILGVGGVILGSLAQWQSALVGLQALLALALLAAAEGVLRR
ncbi:MAG: glycosyltransferase family 4 protein [Planctomycetota bacterium]